MPPTENRLPEVEEEVLLLELGRVELAGMKPLNFVLFSALPGITMDERMLYLVILHQPLHL